MVRFFHVGLVRARREPLVDVSLSVGNGEAVLIHGPSGAGKSTLLRLLLGLESPTRGWITVDGLVVEGSARDVLAAHRRRIAVIPQRPALVPRLTALGNVALARTVAQVPASQARDEAILALERVGAAHLADRPAASLSAGESQWISIARALVRDDSSLIVADEPASELDALGVATFGAILAQEQARGKTLLLTSRSAVFSGLGDHRVVVLEQGRVVLDTAEIEDPAWEESEVKVA